MSDSSQGQKGVEANVTVQVRLLSRDEVLHATPVTLEAASHSVVRREGQVSTSEKVTFMASVSAYGSILYR